MADRSFYGGEPITGGSSAGGEITAGKYRGSEAEQADNAGWKCPSCRTDNVTPFSQGCPSCGAGRPGFHVGQQPPANQGQNKARLDFTEDPPPDIHPRLVAFFEWIKVQDRADLRATENEAILQAAFFAGWAMAQQRALMTQPAIPDRAPELRPEGKKYRTIIAALEIFKEQILALDPDEITSGEWCSVREVDELIQELRAGA